MPTLNSQSKQQSVVCETRLQESVRYPLACPVVYWPESNTSPSPSPSPSTSTSTSTSTSLGNDNPADKMSVKPDNEMVTHPVTLQRVTNASVYLTGGRHAINTADGTLVSADRVPSKTLAEIPWQTHRHLSGTSLLLGNSAGASCYYHWMLDLLPKLGYLDHAGIDINSIDHFLVREAVAPFQIESLKALGIDETRIVETAKKPYLTCDELLSVQLKNDVNLTMHRFIPEWLNTIFNQSKTTAEESKARTKLYIKRPPGIRRAIQNADAVEEYLAARGFDCMAMEGMSIEQQAHVIARADVVVAQHGGALTNLVFAQPGTKVIELFGTHVYPFYFGLANLCNLEYHAILQNSQDYACLVQLEAALKQGSADNLSVTQCEDFTVDLVALDNAVSAVCN